MSKKRIILKYLIALLGILLTGCAGNNTPLFLAESTTPVNEVGTLEEYYLQPGDNLEIIFYNTPELDREVTIRPDGKLSLPPLDEFLVAGLTPNQLDKTVTQKYKDELKDPIINVMLKGVEGQRIYVGGQVNTPMILYLAGKTNALQAIFESGGFTVDANLSTVVIVSKSEKNQPIAKIVDLKKALTGELPESAYLLKPFDMVYVPKTKLATAAGFVSQLYEFIPRNISLNFQYVLHNEYDGNNYDPDRN
jgi:protein involved in polysaccharide export with SLBB domain